MVEECRSTSTHFQSQLQALLQQMTTLSLPDKSFLLTTHPSSSSLTSSQLSSLSEAFARIQSLFTEAKFQAVQTGVNELHEMRANILHLIQMAKRQLQEEINQSSSLSLSSSSSSSLTNTVSYPQHALEWLTTQEHSLRAQEAEVNKLVKQMASLQQSCKDVLAKRAKYLQPQLCTSNPSLLSSPINRSLSSSSSMISGQPENNQQKKTMTRMDSNPDEGGGIVATLKRTLTDTIIPSITSHLLGKRWSETETNSPSTTITTTHSNNNNSNSNNSNMMTMMMTSVGQSPNSLASSSTINGNDSSFHQELQVLTAEVNTLVNTIRQAIYNLDMLASNQLQIRLELCQRDPKSIEDVLLIQNARHVQVTTDEKLTRLQQIINHLLSLSREGGGDGQQQYQQQYQQPGLWAEEVKQMQDSLYSIDQTYTAIDQKMKALRGSLETMVHSLHQLLADAQQYIAKMKQEREQATRLFESQPVGVQEKEMRKVVRGWECLVCCLMNEEEIKMCEGCFHHRYS